MPLDFFCVRLARANSPSKKINKFWKVPEHLQLRIDLNT